MGHQELPLDFRIQAHRLAADRLGVVNGR
jgi:hypothetical protein